MQKFLVLILLIISSQGYSQPNNGAIKTKDGFLLYFNDGQNSHTLNLIGDVDISNFPYIRKDSEWFQFYIANKSEFETSRGSTLENYMRWELEYFEEQLGQELQFERKASLIWGLPTNFWHFKHPAVSIQDMATAVKATYFLDAVHEGLIFRFSYASISGDDEQAFQVLSEIARNLNFYENGIDLEKLQQRVMEGKGY
ncbi:hypothetical protein N9G63_03900 [Chitinophagales bacterium]|nr:hypothetical protein [Chitinophagales bacterium]